MIKIIVSAMLMVLSSMMFAAAQDVFDPAGCQSEYLRPVLGADGDVLYWQNTEGKGCAPSRRGGYRDDVANAPAPVVVVTPPNEGDDEVDPKA